MAGESSRKDSHDGLGHSFTHHCGQQGAHFDWTGLSHLLTSSAPVYYSDFLCFDTWGISFLVFVPEYVFKSLFLPHISSTFFSIWELSQSTILNRSSSWLTYMGMFP